MSGSVLPVFDVPNNYLDVKVSDWLASGRPSLLWKDEISSGAVGDLDLTPLHRVLQTDEVLLDGSRMQELLAGRYVRHASHLLALKFKAGASPRYVSECDLAILLRWQSLAPKAIDAKARDVLRKLAEANMQLPVGKPGIVHSASKPSTEMRSSALDFAKSSQAQATLTLRANRFNMFTATISSRKVHQTNHGRLMKRFSGCASEELAPRPARVGLPGSTQ